MDEKEQLSVNQAFPPISRTRTSQMDGGISTGNPPPLNKTGEKECSVSSFSPVFGTQQAYSLPFGSIFLMTFAGLPPTTVRGGTSRVTTLLAPTIAP